MPIDAVSAYSTNAVLYKYSSGQEPAPAAKKIREGLSDEDQKKIKELTKRDQQVKTHEAAHIAAGGQYVKGAATYQYQKGPDGKMYAVGGEVSIDTSPVQGNAQATIAKMETIKAAALAPADPSGQDRSVAAAASQEEAKARQEESAQKTGSAGGKGEKDASGKTGPPKTSTYNNKGIALLGSSPKDDDQNGIAQKSIAAVNDIQKSIVNMMA